MKIFARNLLFFIVLWLLLRPVSAALQPELDFHPFWTALRIMVIVWLIGKLVKREWNPVLVVILVAALTADWIWNTQTKCVVKDPDDTIASILADITPLYGELKGFMELESGCDMMTGEKLGSFRWTGLFGIVMLNEIGLVGDAARAGANGLEAGLRSMDDIAGAGAKNLDEVAQGIARQSDELLQGAGRTVSDASNAVIRRGDDISRAGDNVARNADDSAILAKAGLNPWECSFAGETLVWTDHGAKPIASIIPGDMLLGYDFAQKTNGYFTTTTVVSHTDTTILDILIEADAIRTTSTHRFFSDEAEWIEADSLAIGDHVRRRDGRVGVVLGQTEVDGQQTMYSLEVAVAHNYYVGATGWLVHNSDCWRSPGGLVYVTLNDGQNSFSHIAMKHLDNYNTDPRNTVYAIPNEAYLVPLLDEAWKRPKRYLVESSGTTEIWVADMGRVIGTKGEKYIRFVIADGNELITAYPVAAIR